MEVPRYIANNPVKAGLVRRPEDYRWSSHAVLLGHPNAVNIPVARDIVTTYFDGDARSFDEFVRRHDTNRATEFQGVVDSQLPDLSLQSSLDTINDAQHQFDEMMLKSPWLRSLTTTLTDYVCGSMGVPSIGPLLPHDEQTQAARGLLLTLLHRSELITLAELAAAFGFGSGQGASRSICRFERAALRDPKLAALLSTGVALLNRAA